MAQIAAEGAIGFHWAGRLNFAPREIGSHQKRRPAIGLIIGAGGKIRRLLAGWH
jgi:hypothetical protein